MNENKNGYVRECNFFYFSNAHWNIFILQTSFTSMSVHARTYHGKFMYGNVLAPKIICQPLVVNAPNKYSLECTKRKHVFQNRRAIRLFETPCNDKHIHTHSHKHT